MSTRASAFGSFDHGAQYFTVRDPRFELAIGTAPGVCKPWSANAVRVLDPNGRVIEAGLPGGERHWVATPGMNGLVKAWAAPLVEDGNVQLQTRVTQLMPDPLMKNGWQLQTETEGETANRGGLAVALAASLIGVVCTFSDGIVVVSIFSISLLPLFISSSPPIISTGTGESAIERGAARVPTTAIFSTFCSSAAAATWKALSAIAEIPLVALPSRPR